MVSNARIAEVAALAGDPARAAMLMALLDGRAFTASELARLAGITPQTASGHVARLTTAGLVSVEKQGRHHYHRLASPVVARMLEGIGQVAAGVGSARIVTGPRDAALRQARTCYDHLAGTLAVALTDALIARGHVELSADAGVVTKTGVSFLNRLGIDLSSPRGKRVFCRPCLDWSERRQHLGGFVGAAICAHCFAAGWIRRAGDTRVVAVTPKGQRAFRENFGI
jgi:DNA-binding transcriptional ArsR family regulator